MNVYVDDSLNDHTSLYRIVDYFAAAATVDTRKLMVPKADQFTDQNEGIDRLLLQLERLGGFRHGCGAGWSDMHSAKKAHAAVKRSHYVSCWTREAESVALWALYSPSLTAVRIQTTVGELRAAIEDLASRYSVLRLSNSDLGKRVVASIESCIVPVQYICLENTARLVSRRVGARRRIVERYARHRREMPTLSEMGENFFSREEQRRLISLEGSCRVKDSSFRHEHEVRAILKLGEETVDERMLETNQFADLNHDSNSSFNRLLEAWGHVDRVCYVQLNLYSDCRDRP